MVNLTLSAVKNTEIIEEAHVFTWSFNVTFHAVNTEIDSSILDWA